MRKVIVRVIPIRYGNTTYKVGDEFEMDDKSYLKVKDYVDVIEIMDEPEKDDFNMEKHLDSLGYNDLKSFLKEQGLNIGSRRKHDEILEFAKEQLL